MTKKEIFSNYSKYVSLTYSRLPIVIVKGKGSQVVDIDGKKYLDFFPGWGVSNVGHCHPKVMSAVRDQIDTLIHIPNNFYHIPQGKLAAELARIAFDGKVFFCNSGAEANEAAIKFARAYGKGTRFEIITTEKSFHGRTMGAVAATGQPKLRAAFAPNLDGFKAVPFNDIDAMKAAITDQTVAIMLELVQGEGGVNVASQKYIEALRALCNEKDILLIVDEVQTGFGRTGQMFAFQNFGVVPDVLTMAKGLGGGLPIGAMLAKRSIADTFQPGMHGSTFGGGPVVCKAALGVIKAIDQGKMLKNAKKLGQYLVESLESFKDECPQIKNVRGLGLMVGVELVVEGKAVIEECLENGLIINCTQGNILRIMPALDITKKQADKALTILRKALGKL